MNTPYPLLSASPAEIPDEDSTDYLGLLDVIVNARWLIIGITALALLIGAAYAFLSPRIYQADTLIQVEQNDRGGNNNILGEPAEVFNTQSTAAAEMEVLRSRLVVGQATDALQLYVSAQPNYIPLVGNWLAKQATGLSTPGIFGFGSYVSGTESIKLGELDVPLELESQKLSLLTTATGYDLYDPNGEKLATGKVGVASEIKTQDGTGHILVSSLEAKPGARFTLMRQSRQNMIKDLQTRIVISERGKPSGVLSLVLEGTNPKTITQILNAVGAAYVKQNVDRKAAEAEKSLIFLGDFLPQLKHQMDDAENKYTQFRDQNRTFDLGTEGSLSLTASTALQTQLFELQQRRRELGALYGSSHPSILAADQQIIAFNKEIARLNTHIKTLPELEQRLLNLSRDVKVNGDLYATLLANQQQLRLVKEGKVGNVRVVDTAQVPTVPVKPNPPLVLTIAGLLGLMLGTGLALLRSKLRSGIQDANEIESRLGLSVFSTVPRVLARPQHRPLLENHTKNRYVLAESSPDDPAIESLRNLRSALRFALQGAPNNIVMLSGPTPNIGKTFTSVNLAAVLGAANERVLLIDTDFRSGHLHRYFGMHRNQGFSELIRGAASLDQVLHKEIMPNVDLITTGALPSNPAESLLLPAAAETLKNLASKYDVVLLDSAPVLAVSDAMALAPHVGTVFMLARAQVTTLGELEEAAKRLAHSGAQVKGVIFNDVDPKNHRFSVKYGNYRHGYYMYNSDAPKSLSGPSK